jgi:RNA polymerase-associated protein RTF1
MGLIICRSDSESEAPEISEDELEDISITPPPRSRRGARKEASPDDEDTFENPYPIEGKYKNEEDRERLMNMAEIEREEVLYQRSEEMQRLKEKRDLAALVRTQIKDQPRRSGREGQLRSEKAGKRDELSELKKRREEKSNAAKVKVVSSAESNAEIDPNQVEIRNRLSRR